MVEQNDSVLAKLDEIETRYSEIEKQITDPEIASNPAKVIPLSKEQGKLRAMVTKYREYKQAVAGVGVASGGRLEEPGRCPHERRIVLQRRVRLLVHF